MKRKLSASVLGDIAAVADARSESLSWSRSNHFHQLTAEQLGQEMTLRKILVPIDFSPGSTKAVQRAVALAQQTSAAITILYVIDILTPCCAGSALNLMRQLRSEAADKMNEFSKSLSAVPNLHTQIGEGLPWEEIISDSQNFDLLIIAKDGCSKGWTCFSQHTRQRVIEQARCPVLAVPDGAYEELTLPAHHHTEALLHPVASV